MNDTWGRQNGVGVAKVYLLQVQENHGKQMDRKRLKENATMG